MFLASLQLLQLYHIKLAMTKRGASYDIDPLTYEEKERDNGQDNLYAPGAPQLKNRKIFKLQRNGNGARLAPETKPQLKIIGLFDTIQEKKGQPDSQAKQPLASLFGKDISGLSHASNLFANLFNREQIKQTSIGSSSQSQVQKTEGEDKPKTSIFGSAGLNANTSIFSQSGVSIFSQQSNKGSSFFSKSAPQKQVFSKQPKNEQEDGDGDSDELQRKQKMEADPAKSQFKFDYGNQNRVLMSVKLVKFKKDKGDLLDCPLTAFILHQPNKEVFYISVQLSATHNNIFSGLILKGKSAVKVLNNKPHNLQLLAFKLNPNQKKIESNVLKLQISTENNAGDEVRFFQTLKQIIEGTLQQAQSK